MTWYHGGTAGLPVGTQLTGAAERGDESKNVSHLGSQLTAYVEEPWAELMRSCIEIAHDPTKLYVTPSLELARAYAGEHGGSLYEVEPHEPTSSGDATGEEFVCDHARIVRVVEEHVPAFSATDRLEKLRTLAEVYGAALRPEPTARLLFDSLLDHIDHEGDWSLHGAEHARRVLDNCIAIGLEKGADLFVVAAFAALHDLRPLTDGHGVYAAAVATELAHKGVLTLDGPQHLLLHYALVAHDQGYVTTDPTVGTCWDADRLELPRVGITVDTRLLSTATARTEGRVGGAIPPPAGPILR